MSLRRKITVAAFVTIFVVGAYLGVGVLYTWWHIPEAYAAWDTGQLLVKYMQVNQNRWPTSWIDLAAVMHSEEGSRMTLYGSRAGDTNYVMDLAKKVRVDWKFEPSGPDQTYPVTRPDGRKFSVVWKGAEPNEMIRAYLRTNSTNAHQRR